MIFVNCNGGPESQLSDSAPLTDVLTLELSFGADEEKLDEEFLLVRPANLAVDDAGNIYAADENRIKVFDSNGNPRTIIGGPGEGPGEFTFLQGLSVSPDDFLIALNISTGYNLYSPDYTSVQTVNYRSIGDFSEIYDENSHRFLTMDKVAAISKSEKIVSVHFNKKVDNYQYMIISQALIFDEAGEIFEIVRYSPEISSGLEVSLALRIANAPSQSEILWAILPEKRLVYTHPTFDRVEKDGEFNYILHFFELATRRESQMFVQYAPAEIRTSIDNKIYTESAIKALLRLSEKLEYFYPVHEILADGNMVFLFPKTRHMKGFKDDIIIDFQVIIIDAISGKIVRTAFFPVVPQVIKNGYAYRITNNKGGFRVVEKYKIDPKVYGK